MRQRRSSKDSISSLLEQIKNVHLRLLKGLVYVGTLPYYRLFNFNTLQPILEIAASTYEPGASSHLVRQVTRWRTRKLAELQTISIACAILAAAVIGSFSWDNITEPYWLASALWYSSLVLSILGVMISAQQVSILELLGVRRNHRGDPLLTVSDVRRYLPLMLTEVHPHQSALGSAVQMTDGARPAVRTQVVEIGRWRPRWKMVFTWQVPIMFMSYSTCCFLAGLTLFVCTPLIQGGEWDNSSNIAIVYLAVFGVAGAVFEFCSFWGYHYVDLGHWSDETLEADAASPL